MLSENGLPGNSKLQNTMTSGFSYLQSVRISQLLRLFEMVNPLMVFIWTLCDSIVGCYGNRLQNFQIPEFVVDLVQC